MRLALRCACVIAGLGLLVGVQSAAAQSRIPQGVGDGQGLAGDGDRLGVPPPQHHGLAQGPQERPALR